MFDMYRVFYIWYGSRVLGFAEWSLCTILRSKDTSRIRLVTVSNTSWYWTLVWHMYDTCRKSQSSAPKNDFFLYFDIFWNKFRYSYDTYTIKDIFPSLAIVIYNQRSIFIHYGTYNGSGRDISWKVPSRMLHSKHFYMLQDNNQVRTLF